MQDYDQRNGTKREGGLCWTGVRESRYYRESALRENKTRDA